MEDFSVGEEVKPIRDPEDRTEKEIETPVEKKVEEKEVVKEIPKKKKKKPEIDMFYLLVGILIGVVLTLTLVQLEVSPYWVTDDTLMNQSELFYNTGYYYGQVDTANYTTITGNFTFIKDNKIHEESILGYCAMVIQSQGGGYSN